MSHVYVHQAKYVPNNYVLFHLISIFIAGETERILYIPTIVDKYMKGVKAIIDRDYRLQSCSVHMIITFAVAFALVGL